MQQRAEYDEVLRAKAAQVDAAHFRQIDLAQVWRSLASRESRVVDSFHSRERCYLVLEPLTPSDGRAKKSLAGRMRILESILLEGAQKNIAIELGLSPSTVAGALKQCLEQLGMPYTTSRISPLLVGAAYAAQADSNQLWGRASELARGHLVYRVVSVERPESELAPLLTPAQYEVVRLLIEGKSHEEIAASRQRSTRTIANQLGAAFRKLGVSGRSELIRRLIVQPGSPSSSRRPSARAVASWAHENPIIVRRYRPRARRAGTVASL